MANFRDCKTYTGFTNKTCICCKCVNMHRNNDVYQFCACDVFTRDDRKHNTIKYSYHPPSKGFYKCMRYKKDWVKELRYG